MRKRRDVDAIVDKANEIKDSAKDLADAGGDALKEFVGAASKAAKDLLEAADKLRGETSEPRKKSRRFLKATLALGLAAGVLANEKARGALGGITRKLRGGGEPAPWDAPIPGSNGELSQQPASVKP